MTDPDAEAMQRLAGGEDLALSEIMNRWQQRVAAFLLSMTGDRAAACDLAQETFVRLYQHRTSYRADAPFASYLFRIAGNLARNHHRWHVRHPTDSLSPMQESGFDPVSHAPGPDELTARADTARAVQRAILTLPGDLREALVLFTYEDMSQAEIAATLGCTAKAVENRVHRARQMLKEKLKPLADGENRITAQG